MSRRPQLAYEQASPNRPRPLNYTSLGINVPRLTSMITVRHVASASITSRRPGLVCDAPPYASNPSSTVRRPRLTVERANCKSPRSLRHHQHLSPPLYLASTHLHHLSTASCLTHPQHASSASQTPRLAYDIPLLTSTASISQRLRPLRRLNHFQHAQHVMNFFDMLYIARYHMILRTWSVCSSI
jgi:hypothetical protein